MPFWYSKGTQSTDGAAFPTSRKFSVFGAGTSYDLHPFNGKVEYTAAWNRRLTTQEVQQFYRNPYQFLVPIAPILINYPDPVTDVFFENRIDAISSGEKANTAQTLNGVLVG